MNVEQTRMGVIMRHKQTRAIHMTIEQTKTVRITVGDKIVRQMTLRHPATLAEVWRLPAVVNLGPNRRARLGQDGVAYVSVDSASFESWRLMARV